MWKVKCDIRSAGGGGKVWLLLQNVSQMYEGDANKGILEEIREEGKKKKLVCEVLKRKREV